MKVLITEQQLANVIKDYGNELKSLPLSDIDTEKIAPGLTKLGQFFRDNQNFGDQFTPMGIVKNKIKNAILPPVGDFPGKVNGLMHPLGKTYPLSSDFGKRRSPVDTRTGRKGSTNHKGIDISVRKGTPIYAPADGVVTDAYDTYASHGNACGKFIQLDVGEYLLKFCHLSNWKIKKGENVKQGQIIGYTGDSGVASGPHLHYEILNKTNHIAYNPLDIKHQPNLA